MKSLGRQPDEKPGQVGLWGALGNLASRFVGKVRIENGSE